MGDPFELSMPGSFGLNGFRLASSAGRVGSFATNNNLSAQFYSLKAAPDNPNVAQAHPGGAASTKTGGMPPLRQGT